MRTWRRTSSLEEGASRSVVVTSAGAGAGCTSVCLGLGAALAGMGHRTAVVDCNLETRTCTGCSASPTSWASPVASRVRGPWITTGTTPCQGSWSFPRVPYLIPPLLGDGGGSSRLVRGLEAGADGDPRRSGSRERAEVRSLSKGFDGSCSSSTPPVPPRARRATTDDLLDAGINLGRGFERIRRARRCGREGAGGASWRCGERGSTRGTEGRRAAERDACSLSSRPSSC